MKRNTAISMYQAVLGIKLNKMSEDMTEAIFANTLALAVVNAGFQSAQETVRKLKHQKFKRHHFILSQVNPLPMLRNQ